MANKDFDREVWNTRERPFSTDNNFEASYGDNTLRDILVGLFTPRISAANNAGLSNPQTVFLGDAFKTIAPGGLAVSLNKGLGFFGDVSNQFVSIGGVVGVNDLSAYKPLVLSQAENIVVPPNATADPRIDIIEVKYRQALIDPINRDTMPAVPPYVFTPGLVNKTFTWLLDGQQGTVVTPAPSTAFISYVQGIPGVSPVAPTPTAGYEKIVEVLVAAGAVTIAQADITDFRRTAAMYGTQYITFEVTTTRGPTVHTLTGVNSPPGVEVATTITDNGTTANRVAWGLRIHAGSVKNVHPTMSIQHNFFGANLPVGSVGMLPATPPDPGFDIFVDSGLLTTVPTYGAAALVDPVIIRVMVAFQYQ